MAALARVAKIAGGAVAFLVYVWFGAVLNAARVKRRKAARRSRRASSPAS